MRIPHIINRNVYEEYYPSKQTKELLKDCDRFLIAEDHTWAKPLIDSLSTLCVISIAKNFEKYPRLDELVNCADRDHLLEILGTDLPLELVIPLIEDEIYWYRRYMDKYGVTSQRKHSNWTWKCILLENHMRELIENAQPQYCDEENMGEITTLLNPYIHSLVITQFQNWIPPLNAEAEDIPLTYPSDHINLEPIFRRLTNIVELVIKFSMREVGEKFSWNMFKVSVDDCKRLSQALVHLKKLRSLTIHNSAIQDAHCQALIKGLIKNTTLEELNLSNCQVSDKGALCIAKLMTIHKKLQKLVLANNKIGKIGAEGISFAMMQDSCCPLTHLNLKLNPLKHEGIMGLFRCLVRTFKLRELNISGCTFEEDTPVRLSEVLTINTSLVHLDISNNWIGHNGKVILVGLMQNNILQTIDLRETNIDKSILRRINRKLRRNKGHMTEDLRDEDTDEEGEQRRSTRRQVFASVLSSFSISSGASEIDMTRANEYDLNILTRRSRVNSRKSKAEGA